MLKNTKEIFLTVSLLSLSLYILNIFFHIGFYFEGGVNDYKKWFPTFYPLAFLFFKLSMPALYGALAYLGLYIIGKRGYGAFFLILFQSVLLIFLLQNHHAGFRWVAAYPYILLFIAINIYYHSAYLTIWRKYIKRYVSHPYYFIFVSYISLSWFLSEFHPFSKYPMYSQISGQSYVFLLRDQQGQIIPLDRFYKVTGNELGHLYYNICASHHIDFDNDSNASMKTEVGQEMFNYISSNQKVRPPFDSIILKKISYHLNNGKIASNETQLYEGKVQ